LLAWAFVRRASERAVPSSPSDSAPTASTQAQAVSASARGAVDAALQSSGVQREDLRAARARDTPLAPGTSRIHGRVIGEQQRALAGALVWVFAVDGNWKPGVPPPELLVRGAPAHAFSATSARDGAFTIDAPVPSGKRLRLEIETSDHRGHVFKELVDKA